MESNKKPIKKSVVATIVFLIVVMLLTFFSKTLYSLNLPSVKLASPTSGSLEHILTSEAIIAAKKEYDLYAPSEQKVMEVLVIAGDRVKTGDVLVKLDTAVLESAMLQLQLEKQQLSDSKRYLSKATYALSLNVIEQKIISTQTEIDSSVLTAPVDGVVTLLAARVGMTANATAPLITVGALGEGLQVTFPVTQGQAAWFEEGDRLDVYIPILNQTCAGLVSQVKSNANGGMDVLATLPDTVKRILPGQLAQIQFKKMSNPYDMILPLSALHTDSGRNYIFRVETVPGPLGDEYRLYKVFVPVLDRDNNYVAVDAEFYAFSQIVVESDQELFGGRVKVTKD